MPLPETSLVLIQNFHTADPFGRFPGIEVMAHETHRTPMRLGQWFGITLNDINHKMLLFVS